MRERAAAPHLSRDSRETSASTHEPSGSPTRSRGVRGRRDSSLVFTSYAGACSSHLARFTLAPKAASELVTANLSGTDGSLPPGCPVDAGGWFSTTTRSTSSQGHGGRACWLGPGNQSMAEEKARERGAKALEHGHVKARAEAV